jgi:ABC-type lipoprotein release transport system permease subunit
MGFAVLGPIAVLNLRRHALRTIANVSGIVLAVAAMVFFISFFRGTYEGSMFASVIDYSTSHIQAQAASFDDDDPDTWLQADVLMDADVPSSPLGDDAEAEGFVARSARLIAPAFAGNGARKAGVLLAGAGFQAEKATFALEKRMKAGSFDSGGAVIGAGLAASLGVGLGEEIRIQASAADGAPNLDYWTVTGIFSSGYLSLDKGLAFIPLADAQEFLSAPASVNKVYLRARSREEAGRLMPELGAALAGHGIEPRFWEDYAKAIVQDARGDKAFYAIFIGILLILSYSTVAGTMKVAIYERRSEIGMLRASGWLRSEIGRLFLLEAAAIGALGALIGLALGGAVVLVLVLKPIDMTGAMGSLNIPSFTMTCWPRVGDFLWSALAGFLAAMAAGVAPAIRASRTEILKAISGR